MNAIFRFHIGVFAMLSIASAIQNAVLNPDYSMWSIQSYMDEFGSIFMAGSLVVLASLLGIVTFANDAASRLCDLPDGRPYLYYIYGALYPLVMAGIMHVISYVSDLLRIGAVLQVTMALMMFLGLFIIPALGIHVILRCNGDRK